MVAAIRQGLGEAGFVEGKDVAIDYRYADGQIDRLLTLAVELVLRPVDVIVTDTGTASVAAKRATAAIPIIFLTGADPIELEFVESFNRPRRNMTGVTVYTNELWAKRMEVMRELVPSVTLMAILINPKSATAERARRDALETGRILGLEILIFNASTENDINKAFESIGQQRAPVLLVQAEPYFINRRKQIVRLDEPHRWPYSPSHRLGVHRLSDPCFPVSQSTIIRGTGRKLARWWLT